MNPHKMVSELAAATVAARIPEAALTLSEQSGCLGVYFICALALASPTQVSTAADWLQQMSEEDQKAFRMYGKVPQKSVLTKINKVRARFATRLRCEGGKVAPLAVGPR